MNEGMLLYWKANQATQRTERREKLFTFVVDASRSFGEGEDRKPASQCQIDYIEYNQAAEHNRRSNFPAKKQKDSQFLNFTIPRYLQVTIHIGFICQRLLNLPSL